MRRTLLLLTGLIAFVLTTKAVIVTYTTDNTTVFKNPERGFTEELSYQVSVSYPNVVKGNISSSWGANECRTMPMVLYNYGNFKSQYLPDAILNAFDEDMQELRTHGFKCVLRFAYTEDQNDKEDATPVWVKRHLEQLKPHLAANADVIYVLEAGFVGVWGEWYYTNNYGNESQHMNDNRRLVIQYLFENVPEDRFVLFRYPLIKMEYLNDTTPLTAADGFSGTIKARMGCHNDAFLNKYGNDGTYGRDGDGPDDDPILRQYIADETLYVPNGGETNVESSSTAKKVYMNAPAEMATYHWSFCGTSYATQVTDRWRNSGIYDTLNIHMGYRYNLLDAQFSDQAEPGGKMDISIHVRNDGYAPIYNQRTAYIVLKAVSGQQSAISIPLQTDPRRWAPNGQVSWINEQIDLPANIEGGTYQLYLWLPDQYESIKNDPRYAVRFANPNVWDANTGYNNLNASIVINQSTPVDPQGVGNVQGDNVQCTKVIKNGQFLIVRPDGTRYTVFGQICQ